MGGPFVVEIERGADVGKRFTIGASATIGRQEGLEITLNDAQVSRQHARLEALETRVLLTDLGGANGIFVNRKRVDGSTSLLPGDVIEIGGTLLRLMGATAPQPKTAVAMPAPVPTPMPTPGAEIASSSPAPAPFIPEPTAPPPARSRGPLPLIIGGVAIALVLLCICVATILATVGR